jgi:transposase
MMQITPEQYDKIKGVLPVQRGNVRVENIDFLNAILYVAENGCKWRKLPEKFGPWHTIYTRMRRWADNEVWPRVLEALKTELLIDIDITALSLDSTSVKVHPDGMGPLKKTANSRSAKVAVAGTRKFI